MEPQAGLGIDFAYRISGNIIAVFGVIINEIDRG